VISEVLYRPAAIGDEGVFEPADEWIEIYNLESYPVDLSVYKIGDAAMDDTGEGMLMFPPGASIEPGQVVVIANQADRFYKRYGVTPDFEILNTDPLVPDMVKYTTWSSGSVNLANTGDEVLLLDAGETEVDIVSWGNSSYAFNPPVSCVEAGHSIERCPVNVDTDTAIDWRDQPNPSPGNIDCR
jgi:glycerophosphoryl diester phosphodiesterase